MDPVRKTLSFGVLHMVVAFAVTWLLTGSAAVGGLVTLIEPLCNTIAYHWHEKAWTRFGRPRPASSA